MSLKPSPNELVKFSAHRAPSGTTGQPFSAHQLSQSPSSPSYFPLSPFERGEKY
jgi:hypothetical protein